MTGIRAVKTNGIGRRCTSHLNLTVTLEQAWKLDPWNAIRIPPRKP